MPLKGNNNIIDYSVENSFFSVTQQAFNNYNVENLSQFTQFI